ncbi:sigma 54-interacting transcriptional regulator [Pelotomaculum isophthalicicum JI]|uniref:HTH-type transcriptional regulatory protein TyrR n=1 Tax=Pelotomaculum isophthalicicum JI TaxID=947010 RepID=A0A9X4JTJ3_9FIRM|nr:sigma 54-interacting transcriptional regulator [Pelotomaculum isophthalicicum]MDF9408859.1 sigma 54-interacting transcriptional regulator [Pelotomaculum isophthalicicum JI]
MLEGQMIPFILDYIHHGIIAINQKGIVIICNKAAQKMLGFNQPVLDRPIASLLPETKLPNVVNTGQSEYGKRFTFNGKTFVVNRTPIIEHDTVIGAVTVFQDITDLDEISTELESFKKINKELEGIIATSYDGILITDGEGRVLKINKSLLRITDLTTSHFLGKKIDSLYVKGYFTSEPIAKLARVNKKIVTGIQIIKTGKVVMVTSTPVFDDNGDVIRVVTNARDMSEIINLQEQLAQSRNLSDYLRQEFNKSLKDELLANEMITRNPEMYKILELTKRVAGMEVTILLQGESGVGKEVFAKLIHVWSKRKGAFIKVNCGAIPGPLLESELFGYSRGAFTGANKEGKPGLFELANDGTLFLDEIEDLPLDLQGKFLRVLQDQEFVRLGGTKVIKVNVRLIAASNRDLTQMIKERKFREDLYYRLNVVPILIPPLRDRTEDIPLLIDYFLSKFNKKYSTNKVMAPGLMKDFLEYHWPGNIRELINTLERLVITSESDFISNDAFTAAKRGILAIDTTSANNLLKLEQDEERIPSLKEALENTEKDILTKALKKYKKSRQVGQVLGISHTAVLKKIKKYQMKA